MPAKDKFHEAVKNALVKDGWKITADPLTLEWDGRFIHVDLGAERLIAAEKEARKIAVEIKTFIGLSVMEDLEKAVGQYIVYDSALEFHQPERELFLAVPEDILERVFEKPNATLMIKKHGIRIIGYNAKNEEIVRWKI